MKRFVPLFGILAIALVGCSGGDTQTSATKQEQNTYQNPVKEPPAEAGMMSPPGGGAGPGGQAGPPGGPPPGPPPGAQAGPG